MSAKALKGIRLDDETIKEIQKLAEIENRNFSNMLETLVKEALRKRKLKQ